MMNSRTAFSAFCGFPWDLGDLRDTILGLSTGSKGASLALEGILNKNNENKEFKLTNNLNNINKIIKIKIINKSFHCKRQVH